MTDEKQLVKVADTGYEYARLDAIPVQWLEKKALDLDIVSMESVFRLITEWREEHEQDGSL